MAELTHVDSSGQAHMVNVAEKAESHRIAVAEGTIRMQPATLKLISEGGHEKGDVLGVARIAGIMAAKRTDELIPLCHPLPLSRIAVELRPLADEATVVCRATVETIARTGVEMEALTAVQIALLTVYDMCKAVDRSMCIETVCLLEKRGGRSGPWHRDDGPRTARDDP